MYRLKLLLICFFLLSDIFCTQNSGLHSTMIFRSILQKPQLLLRISILPLFLILARSGWAQQSFVVPDSILTMVLTDDTVLSIRDYVVLFVDSSGNKTFDKIICSDFISIDSAVFPKNNNFYSAVHAVWFRISINFKEDIVNHPRSKIAYIFPDRYAKIQFFQLLNGEIISDGLGGIFEYVSRSATPWFRTALPIRTDTSGYSNVYIRVEGDGSIIQRQNPFLIGNKQAFLNELSYTSDQGFNFEYFFTQILLGILVFLFLWGFGKFLITRKIEFLFYSAVALCHFIYFTLTFRISFTYPGRPFFADVAFFFPYRTLFLDIGYVCYGFFIQNILDTKNRNKGLHRFIRILVIVGSLGVILQLSAATFFSSINLFLSLARVFRFVFSAIGISLLIGIIASARRIENRFVIYAFGALIILSIFPILIPVLLDEELIHSLLLKGFYPLLTTQLGVLFELFLFQMALAYKLKKSEKERIKAVREKERESARIEYHNQLIHDFKDPVQIIHHDSSKLASSKTENIPIDISRICEQSKKLLFTIDQISKLNQMEQKTSKEKIELSVINIIGAIKRSIYQFESICKDRSIKMNFFSKDREVNSLIYAEGLDRIVINLISNAIESFASDQHHKEINISVDRIKNKSIEVKIEDNGIGINEKDVEKIFHPYIRIHSMRYKGTGLGLAIVKQTVEMMEGRIKVVSKEGEGTAFIITLPFFQEKTSHKVVTSKAQVAEIPLTHKNNIPKILIIDNEPHIIDLFKQHFINKYDIIGIKNGNKAFKKAKEESFHLIICDLQMPGINGLELIKKLKTEPIIRNVPLIVFSGIDNIEVRTKAIAFGAIDYVNKPVKDWKEFTLKIENWVREGQKWMEQNEPYFWNGKPILDEFGRSIIDAIQNNYSSSSFNIEKLAGILNVSKSTLTRKFDKIDEFRGLKIGQLIREYRLTQAQKLLKAGEQVAQTAYSVGYNDRQAFAEAYKKYFSVYPSSETKNIS